MHNCTAIDFEHQKLAILSFRTINHEIVESRLLGDAMQGSVMLGSKVLVEIGHEPRLLCPLLGTFGHAPIQIVDHPVLGYCHMTCIRLSIDQNNPIFAKE